MSVVPFTGMKIFSTTLARDREHMGDNITRWVQENPQYGGNIRWTPLCDSWRPNGRVRGARQW